MEYAIEKPSNKLLAATELESDTCLHAHNFCFLLSTFLLLLPLALMWKTAPPRMPIPPFFLSSGSIPV